MTNISHDYERAVVSILKWLHIAENELVGRTVLAFNSEVGTCKGLCLDDNHGLCFTFDDPEDEFVASELGLTLRKWYPVSTIKRTS